MLKNSINLLANSWKVIDCPSRITLFHGLAAFIIPKSYKRRHVALQNLVTNSSKNEAAAECYSPSL